MCFQGQRTPASCVIEYNVIRKIRKNDDVIRAAFKEKEVAFINSFLLGPITCWIQLMMHTSAIGRDIFIHIEVFFQKWKLMCLYILLFILASSCYNESLKTGISSHCISARISLLVKGE